MKRCPLTFYFGSVLALGGCSSCLTTPLAQFHDPAGITFTIVRADCDTLAKDSAVSISATRDNEGSSALLLKYDPWTDELPQVYVGPGDTIFIHVSKASSILEQHHTWGSRKVEITIDKLAYPERDASKEHEIPT
jgi:hypothetical protein